MGCATPGTGNLITRARCAAEGTGHLSIEMTLDDPIAYAKPLTYAQPAVLLPDSDLLEFFCTETKRTSVMSRSETYANECAGTVFDMLPRSFRAAIVESIGQ